MVKPIALVRRLYSQNTRFTKGAVQSLSVCHKDAGSRTNDEVSHMALSVELITLSGATVDLLLCY